MKAQSLAALEMLLERQPPLLTGSVMYASCHEFSHEPLEVHPVHLKI